MKKSPWGAILHGVVISWQSGTNLNNIGKDTNETEYDGLFTHHDDDLIAFTPEGERGGQGEEDGEEKGGEKGEEEEEGEEEEGNGEVAGEGESEGKD